jgi:2-dehydropantoate 2-reductase
MRGEASATTSAISEPARRGTIRCTSTPLRDVKRGGPTEVEYILGFMLNKASEANIAHRTLLLAYAHIKAFEKRRAAGDLP